MPWRSSTRASSRTPPRRDDVRLLDGELVRYLLPERSGGQSVADVLDLLEEGGLRRGAASPDHWVHVSPGGPGGSLCPAIEPEETGLTEPWPPEAPQGKGSEVSVVVVDTGWHPPAATDPRTPWLQGRRRRRRAQRPRPAPVRRPRHVHRRRRALHRPGDPKVYVEGFAIGGVGGGGILESDLVVQLEEALDHDPQVINLSAGCRTRLDLPSIALETFYRTRLRKRDCVLVAAAGNDSSSAPFWPAAFDWASASARSIATAGSRTSPTSACPPTSTPSAATTSTPSPTAPFVCHETPDKGDIRVFSTGLARWSGTSFSAPVVAGLIAREISETGCPPGRRPTPSSPEPTTTRTRGRADPGAAPALRLTPAQHLDPATSRRSVREGGARYDGSPV